MAKPKRLTNEDERRAIQLLRSDPVLAASKLLIRNGKPVQLFPHQRIVLRSLWENKPFNLLLMGRGASKTFMCALFLTLWGVLNPRDKLGIVSASYRQAQLVFDEITAFVEESPLIKDSISKGPSKLPTESSLTWRKGGFIKALPLGDGIFLLSRA